MNTTNLNEFALDAIIVRLPLEVKLAVLQIINELKKAKEKHRWPSDYIHAAAVVSEESGELTRAALNAYYEKGDPSEMEKEAVQVGATAIRFLIETDLRQK